MPARPNLSFTLLSTLCVHTCLLTAHRVRMPPLQSQAELYSKLVQMGFDVSLCPTHTHPTPLRTPTTDSTLLSSRPEHTPPPSCTLRSLCSRDEDDDNDDNEDDDDDDDADDDDNDDNVEEDDDDDHPHDYHDDAEDGGMDGEPE
eukprot:3130606-Rhodomonas_salina.2